jgi:hypothetical protein
MGRMPSIRSKDQTSKKTSLLREVVELLMWELTTITSRKWEDLPELKRKKGVLAGRLRKFDWTLDPEITEPLDMVMLRGQIVDLEYQSRRKIQTQLQIIKGRIDSLQVEKNSWAGCLNNYVHAAN